MLDMKGKPRVDEPGLFQLNGNARNDHDEFFKDTLGIYHMIKARGLSDVNDAHINHIAAQLVEAEGNKHYYVRFAMKQAGKPSREHLGRIFAMRNRFDSEMECRSIMWKVGAVYEFNSDLRFQRLRSNGASQGCWSDTYSYIIYDFRMIGIEDLSGVTTE